MRVDVLDPKGHYFGWFDGYRVFDRDGFYHYLVDLNGSVSSLTGIQLPDGSIKNHGWIYDGEKAVDQDTGHVVFTTYLRSDQTNPFPIPPSTYEY